MVLRLRYDHWLSIASPLLNPYSSVLFDFSSKKHLIRAFHLNICLPMVADTNWLGSPEFLTDFHTSLTNGFILLENCFFLLLLKLSMSTRIFQVHFNGRICPFSNF